MKKLVINEISCVSGGVNEINTFNRVFVGINILLVPTVIIANYLASKNQKEQEKQEKYTAAIKELCQKTCTEKPRLDIKYNSSRMYEPKPNYTVFDYK
jgi:hypothetical protein